MKKNKIFYGWWIVFATNITCMLGFGTWLYSFSAFVEPMILEFGWNRTQISFGASLRSFEGGVAGPFIGWAIDRYGARNIIRFGAIVSGLGFIGLMFTHSLISFYLLYGLVLSIGMSAMLYLPAFTVIAKWFAKKLSFAYSLLSTGAAVGGAICVPTAAILITYFGWRFAFLVIGVTILVIVLPLTFIIKDNPEEMGLRRDNEPPIQTASNSDLQDSTDSNTTVEQSVESDYTIKQALSSPSYYVLAFCLFCTSLAFSVVIFHGVICLTDMGITYINAAKAIGSITAVSVIGRLVFGFLGDKIDKRYLYTIAYFMIGSGMLVLSKAHDMSLVYIFIVLFGVGFGATIPLNAAIRAEYFGRAALGKINGFMAPVSMLAGTTGPVAVGYAFDITHSYQASFFVLGLLPFLGGIMILFARPKKIPAMATA